MSIRKVITDNGEVKHEVYLYTGGKGSKRLRRRFNTKIEAQEFKDEFRLRKREQKRAGNGVRDFEETTFREEADYWLEHRSKRFSPSHLKRAKGVLAEILPTMGHLSPIRFQPEFLSDFQSQQLGQGLRPATVNRKTEVIRAILAFSVKRRRIPYNPSAGFDKLKAVPQGVSFWEEHEAQAFLSAMDKKYPKGSENRWIYVVYLLDLNTALRAGEIWGLQPQDLVQGGSLLYIQRQYDRVKKDFGPLKWNMPPRYVPCNEELFSELTALIAERRVSPGKTIFQSPAGEPVCHDDFAKRSFKADVVEANIRTIRFHDLRHTATTLMIAAGTDVKTTKEICGHKSLKTTMDYAHLLGGAIKKVAQAFWVSAKRLTSVEPPKSPEPPQASSMPHNSSVAAQVADDNFKRGFLRLVR